MIAIVFQIRRIWPDQPYPPDRFQQITIAAASPSDVLQSDEEGGEEDEEEEEDDEREGALPAPTAPLPPKKKGMGKEKARKMQEAALQRRTKRQKVPKKPFSA